MPLNIDTREPDNALNSIGRIRRIRLLAILPVLIVAIINTGYQSLHSAAGAASHGIVAIISEGLFYVMPVFAVALLSVSVWERIFTEKRDRAFDPGVVFTALLVTMLMPPNAGMIHIVIGVSFAMVFSHGIFGGEGRSFLNPALVAVAMMQITFPGGLSTNSLWQDLNGYAGSRYLQIYDEQNGLPGIDWWDAFIGNTQGLMGATSVVVILFAAIWLVYHRMICWRLLSGHFIGLIVMAIICDYLFETVLNVPWYWQPVLGSFAFASVFIATDPSASSSTNPGRWIQGLLAGALVVLLRMLNPSHADSVIPVLLLVSLLAPLIDHVVIWFNIRRRASGRA